jgi:hypothetical protein
MPTRNTAYHEAWRFFLANAGYSYNPQIESLAQGKARSARRFAKAERDAASKGIRFEWEFDPDGCIGCDCGSDDCECSTGNDHETLECLAFDKAGKLVASLGSVCKPSREYRRVVEAELALEVLGR